MRIAPGIAAMFLASAGSAAAQELSPLPAPACVAVLEFAETNGVGSGSGKVLAEIATRELRERGVSNLLERSDLGAFLQMRRVVLPKQRDTLTVAAVGRSLQVSAVLDGMVLEYDDGTRSATGAVAVEVLLRMVDPETKRTVWESTGRATGKSIFRFRRQPLSEVATHAVERALASLTYEGSAPGSCPPLASTPLVAGAAEQSIVANAPSDASAAPLRIVRTYSDESGQERAIDISEVRVLHFNAGESSLKPGMEYLISEIAAVLRDNPDLRLIIEGHTDADPALSTEGRFGMSFSRAVAVYEALRKEHKVEPKRVLLQAAGERAPVAPNDTKFNRTLNRRVEFKFLTSNQ